MFRRNERARRNGPKTTLGNEISKTEFSISADKETRGRIPLLLRLSSSVSRVHLSLGPVADLTAFADESDMTIAQLDIIFPYVCFAYGAVMTLVLASKTLARIADDKLPSEMVARWRSHRALAITCLLVGGAWILQGIWLS